MVDAVMEKCSVDAVMEETSVDVRWFSGNAANSRLIFIHLIYLILYSFFKI